MLGPLGPPWYRYGPNRSSIRSINSSCVRGGSPTVNFGGLAIPTSSPDVAATVACPRFALISSPRLSAVSIALPTREPHGRERIRVAIARVLTTADHTAALEAGEIEVRDRRARRPDAKLFGKITLGVTPRVTLANDSGWGFRATYGVGDGLTLNLHSVRYGTVEGYRIDLDDLLIHEYAHHYGSHLSADYDRGLSRIGAKAIHAVRQGKL